MIDAVDAIAAGVLMIGICRLSRTAKLR